MRNVSAHIRRGRLRWLATQIVPLALAAHAVGQTPAPEAPAAAPATKAPRPAVVRLIDAAGARSLGLEIGWQSQLPLRPQGVLKGVRVERGTPGSVFAWDDDAVILSMDAATGDVRWRSHTASTGAGNSMLDVTSAATPTTSLVVGLGDTSCLMLDARTGNELGRMPYPHVPSTPASRSDGDVVFGGRGGHLVWLGFRDDKVPARVRERRVPGQEAAVDVAAVHCVLYEELVHRLKGGFSAVPVASGDVVIACSTSGQVSCFRTSQRACVWSIQLPGGVAAQPAIGEGVCYVASRDQHLRCLDLATGKTLWKWFCESTLENPPLLAGELVMLQVPELGLVAFETGGSASRTRSPKWKSAASGNPITRLAEGVLVWDATSRKLSLVDQSTGVVRDERTLTEVDSVHASAPIGGELYLMSSDGRVQRCVPVSPVTTASKPGVAETPAAAAPQEATSPAGDETSEPPVDPAGN